MTTKTTRIRLSNTQLIYCTSQIATLCSKHLIRMNQIMHPRKGHREELHRLLTALANADPGSFSNSSLMILGCKHLMRTPLTFQIPTYVE